MKRSSMPIALFAVPAIGLLVAAMAFGQRPNETSQVPIGGLPGGPARESALVQGFSEMVTVSKNGETVWLFSFQTGCWHKQAIPKGQGPIKPTVGRGVVAFRTRTMMFACSSQTGSWDSVEIGDVLAQPTVGTSVAAFRAKNTVYAFSSETGTWDSMELDEGVAGHPTVGFSFAVLDSESKTYAFSGKRGKWAMVDRDKP
jgi:hypothetical protein